MSSDDQYFLDVLSSIPNHITKYSSDVADFIDDHVEKVAEVVREQLASAPWIPDSMRPRLPPPRPDPSIVAIHASTTYERVHDWVVRHKVVTGVMVIAAGVLVYRGVRRSRLGRKTRRAKRARNGGRLEVVVIAGSPTVPLTRSLALDMERKGFIVYVVCNSMEDEVMVQNLARPDVRALSLDITDPPNAGASIERFAHYLQASHAPVAGAKRIHLSLASVILIPSLSYQTSPIATIPPSSFADLFNTHLLHPILTVQSFLPLLTSRSGDKSTAPKVLVMTPSIITSINPPFHAAEATVCSALSAFTEVLAGELRPLAIPVTHVQLGTFDFSGFTPAQMRTLPAPEPAETLAWPEAARHAYGRNFVAQATSAISAGRIRGMRGSSLRDLHNAVFDVIDGSNTSGVVRVGLGADLYGFVGRWMPRNLVSWMMGNRRVDDLGTWKMEPLSSPSPKATSDSEESHDFVAVQEGLADSHVWKEGDFYEGSKV